MIQQEAFEALASSTNGIAKLRELILELAVRGLLVPQDPNDESVVELLEVNDDMRATKAQEDHRADSGEQKLLATENCWSIPSSWVWRGLADLTLFIDYRGKTPIKVSQGIRLITAKNVKKGFINPIPEEFITELEYQKWMTRGLPQKGDVLFTTEAPMGNAATVSFTEEFALAQRVICLRPYHALSPNFLVLQLLSKPFQTILDITGTGLTAKGIKAAKLKRLPIALPPLAEQHRIIAKVDELMTLCDQLDQRQNHSNTVHQRLLQTLLESLTQAVDNEAFQKTWSQIAAHFDTLFTTEASIDQLKQVILQLAVMGKLVPQDSNDKPASVLLKKIAEEKARMVKEGKIKKQTPLPEVTELYEKSELPKGWVVTRFGELFNLISGQHLKPQEYSESYEIGMIPYLTGPAEFGEKYPSVTRYTFEKRAVANPGDVLVTCKGSGVGKLNEVETEIAISRQLMSIQPILITTKFTKLLASSLYDQIRSNIVGIAIPGISREDLMEIVITLPPLDEQHRITTKFDELMAICDQLKSQISKSQQTQEHLATAIVEKAVA